MSVGTGGAIVQWRSGSDQRVGVVISQRYRSLRLGGPTDGLYH